METPTGIGTASRRARPTGDGSKRGTGARGERETFRDLEHLRNAVVHGSRPERPEIAQMLKNPERLSAFVEQAIGRLLT